MSFAHIRKTLSAAIPAGKFSWIFLRTLLVTLGAQVVDGAKVILNGVEVDCTGAITIKNINGVNQMTCDGILTSPQIDIIDPPMPEFSLLSAGDLITLTIALGASAIVVYLATRGHEKKQDESIAKEKREQARKRESAKQDKLEQQRKGLRSTLVTAANRKIEHAYPFKISMNNQFITITFPQAKHSAALRKLGLKSEYAIESKTMASSKTQPKRISFTFRFDHPQVRKAFGLTPLAVELGDSVKEAEQGGMTTRIVRTSCGL